MIRHLLWMLAPAAVIVAAMVFVSVAGCTVVVDEPGARPTPQPSPNAAPIPEGAA